MESNWTSVAFNIPRQSTIPSDNTEHKVIMCFVQRDIHLSHFRMHTHSRTYTYIHTCTRTHTHTHTQIDAKDGSNYLMQVTVAIIDLKPELEHVMVPRLSSETYLQAVVKNTSSYSILSGPANVFLDNNFIAKVTAYNIMPQAEIINCR